MLHDISGFLILFLEVLFLIFNQMLGVSKLTVVVAYTLIFGKNVN